MSRTYLMEVKVVGFKPKKAKKIKAALSEEWIGWEKPKSGPGFIYAYGEGTLSGGEDEEDFHKRVRKAVKKANGVRCRLVQADLYIEDADWTVHDLQLAPPPIRQKLEFKISDDCLVEKPRKQTFAEKVENVLEDIEDKIDAKAEAFHDAVEDAKEAVEDAWYNFWFKLRGY